MEHLIIKGEVIPEKLSFLPTFVIGFFTEHQHQKFTDTAEHLRARYDDICIIGCSSSGNLVDRVPYHTDENVWCLMNIEKESFSVFFSEEESSLSFPENWEQKDKNALLFYSDYERYIQRNINEICNQLEGGTSFGAVAGGSISSRNKGTLYHDGKFYTKGVVCCLIDASHYELHGSSIHDFEPAGIELLVTATSGQMITQIEDEPALKLIEEIIGTITPQRIEMFDTPFFLKGTDNSYRTLASLEGIDRRKNSLKLSRVLLPGEKIKIAIPASHTTMKNRFKKAKQIIPPKKSNAVMLMFLSASLSKHWHTMEALYIMKMTKDLAYPFLGLHTQGEILPHDDRPSSTLQNQTMSIVTLTKKKV